MANDIAPPKTPDGRYLVVRGRLWRTSNPAIEPDERQRLVDALMDARRAVRDGKGNHEAIRRARRQVNGAKTALGERGPVWWTDGKPDLNRRMAADTEYAEWYASTMGNREPD